MLNRLPPRALVAILAALLLPATVHAVFQPKRSPEVLEAMVEPPVISVETLDRDASDALLEGNPGWRRFGQMAGGTWEMQVDRRSGLPSFLIGSGMPWIPGRGNDLVAAAPVDLDHLEAMARRFLAEHRDLFAIDPDRLVLDPLKSGAARDATYWNVAFGYRVGGVPVRDALVFVRLSHGNLVQYGAELVTEVAVDTTPGLAREDAAEVAFARRGRPAAERVADPGSLFLLPWSASPDRYDGAPGGGLEYRLCWNFRFRLDGDRATWVAWVDAHTGELLAFFDDNRYACAGSRAAVTGGVWVTGPNDAAEVVRAMPYTRVTNSVAGALTTTYGGLYDYPGGTSSSTLDGPYFDPRCAGTCTDPVNAFMADASSGNLPFGTGVLNTVGNGLSLRSERNVFYASNLVRALADKWLDRTWFATRVPANFNIDDSCNAFWDGTSINFYVAAGGCNNTAETIGVVFHEYGHGLDQNTGGGSDGGLGEGIGDVVDLMVRHSPQIGDHFFVTGGSVRNIDSAVSGVKTWSRDGGSAVHNAGQIFGQTVYDLAQALIARHGTVGGWAVSERLFFTALPSFTRQNPASASSVWNAYLAVDDDDGDLTNGIPHGAEITAAFRTHEINGPALGGVVGASTPCTPPAAPALTLRSRVNPGTGRAEVTVDWPPVAGAARYRVLRHERPRDSAFLVVADLPASVRTFTDGDVLAGVAHFYRVEVVNGGGCVSLADDVASITPSNPQLEVSAWTLDDSASNASGNLDPGETANLTLELRNVGGADATGVTVRASTPDPDLTLLVDTLSAGDIPAGATRPLGPPHLRLALADLAARCGDTVVVDLELTSSDGCWTAQVTLRIGSSVRVLSDEFETNRGFTARDSGGAGTGRWERADPEGTTIQPEDDHSASGGLCWVTGAARLGGDGGNDVDGLVVTLTSPPFDASGLGQARVGYWRWFASVDSGTPEEDFLRVEASVDGFASSVLLERILEDRRWAEPSFTLPASLLGSGLQVRFETADLPNNSLVEAAIDDFYIDQLVCPRPERQPRLLFAAWELDDVGGGDGDGVAEPGELIVLPITWRNDGNATAELVAGTLALDGSFPGVVVADGAAGYADILETASGRSLPDHFALDIDHNVACGDRIDLRATVTYRYPGGDLTATGRFSVLVGRPTPPSPVYLTNFDGATDAGWRHGAVRGSDDWERRAPAGLPAPSDPPAAWSAPNCWGTDLTLEPGTGNVSYPADTLEFLESPPIDCSSCVDTHLRLRRWLTVEDATFDTARILVGGTVVWQNPVGSGTDHMIDREWVAMDLDISALADGNPAVVVRFELESDGGLEFGGWNVDDLSLVLGTDTVVCTTCSAPSVAAIGNVLRVVRDTGFARLDWAGYPGAAPAFRVYGVGAKEGLADLRSVSPLAPSLPVRGWTDPAAIGASPDAYYQILALDECGAEVE